MVDSERSWNPNRAETLLLARYVALAHSAGNFIAWWFAPRPSVL